MKYMLIVLAVWNLLMAIWYRPSDALAFFTLTAPLVVMCLFVLVYSYPSLKGLW